jgi:hypothetical protein
MLLGMLIADLRSWSRRLQSIRKASPDAARHRSIASLRDRCQTARFWNVLLGISIQRERRFAVVMADPAARCLLPAACCLLPAACRLPPAA